MACSIAGLAGLFSYFILVLLIFSSYSSLLTHPLSSYAPSLMCLIHTPGLVLWSAAGPTQVFSEGYPQQRVLQLAAICTSDTTKDCQEASHSGCPILHVYRCVRALSGFPVTPTLTSIRWCLVLISLSLIIREIERLICCQTTELEPYRPWGENSTLRPVYPLLLVSEGNAASRDLA